MMSKQMFYLKSYCSFSHKCKKILHMHNASRPLHHYLSSSVRVCNISSDLPCVHPNKRWEAATHVNIFSSNIRSFSAAADGKPRENKKKDESDESNLSLYKRFKQMYTRYWYVLIPVHSVTSIVWYGSFFIAAKNGVDVVPMVKAIGITSEKIINLLSDSNAGYYALAYAMYKVATPARYTVTLGCTTLSINYLKNRGYIKPVPSREELKEMYEDKKEEMKERFEDKKGEVSKKIEDKKLEMTKRLEDRRVNFNRKMDQTREEFRDKMEDRREDLKEKFNNRREEIIKELQKKTGVRDAVNAVSQAAEKYSDNKYVKEALDKTSETLQKGYDQTKKVVNNLNNASDTKK